MAVFSARCWQKAVRDDDPEGHHLSLGDALLHAIRGYRGMGVPGLFMLFWFEEHTDMEQVPEALSWSKLFAIGTSEACGDLSTTTFHSKCTWKQVSCTGGSTDIT
eukprot:4356906-Amphidinium_carterae.1